MWVELCNFFLRIFSHTKFVLIYYILGGRAILHDLICRKYNDVVLKKKSNYVAIVTGGARGIGSAVVKMLMKCDMHVVIACREVDKGKQMIENLRKSGVSSGNATVFELELTSLKSVKKFAAAFNSQFEHLNLLVNNAGIMFPPYTETEEGYESQFGVNYLSHFLLTQLVLPAMKEASKKFKDHPRIVNVTSCAHEVSPEINFSDINMKNRFITQAAYAQSKLCQLMFTKTLDRKLEKEGSRIQVMAVHPGIVDTELFDGTLIKLIAPWILKLFCKSPEEGAKTVTYCCVDDKAEGARGQYFSNCCYVPCSNYANDLKTQEKLYDFSMRLVKPFLSNS